MADRKKEFIRLINGAARRTSVMDAFGDAVHLMALSLWAPLAPNRAAVEADYGATRRKYADGDLDAFARALKLVVEELEETRKEFLGAILERIGAANKAGGQFLTPRAVGAAMAMAEADECARGHVPGEVIRIGDMACGASVLLVEMAERLIACGVPQRDILVIAGDVDQRACDMSYVELSLLGYAAKVEHRDALAASDYSPPRYTAGYFLHSMPLREGACA